MKNKVITFPPISETNEKHIMTTFFKKQVGISDSALISFNERIGILERLELYNKHYGTHFSVTYGIVGESFSFKLKSIVGGVDKKSKVQQVISIGKQVAETVDQVTNNIQTVLFEPNQYRKPNFRTDH